MQHRESQEPGPLLGPIWERGGAVCALKRHGEIAWKNGMMPHDLLHGEGPQRSPKGDSKRKTSCKEEFLWLEGRKEGRLVDLSYFNKGHFIHHESSG